MVHPETRAEPSVVEGAAAYRAADFLFKLAVEEKGWPADAVRMLLDRESVFVAVMAGAGVAGAAQVLYARPYPCEQPPLHFRIPDDGRVPCEVSLIAVDPRYRRSTTDSAAILDALVKGLYLLHAARGGTHIYTLCEDWTFAVLTDAFAQIAGRKLSAGFHYWCGTARCPSPACRLTYVCELDMRQGEARWAVERPDFWAYLHNPVQTSERCGND